MTPKPSTEEVEPIEGFFQFLSNQATHQPAKPLNFVHSTWPVVQDNVLRYQAILGRDSENHRLAVSRILRAMALCAHGGGVGSEREPKLTADHVSTSSIVCRYCDVGQSREKDNPSGACQIRSHSHSMINQWCLEAMRSYWLNGAVCKPPSKAAGTTVNETLATSPKTAVALPAMPGVADDWNGLSSCQHSMVDALCLAPVTVIFKRSACDALAPRPRMSVICILMVTYILTWFREWACQ